MNKTILVDPSRCLQCSNCWVACKDEHCDNDWSPITAPQGPDQWWVKVYEKEAASGAHMKLHRVPVMCQHCENPSCMAVCAQGAITKRDDGIVLIDPEKCTGCNDCVAACPYHAVFANIERGIAQKCTMCAHLLDAGWEQPRCVTACPNDALQFVDVQIDLADENLHAPLEYLRPDLGTKPQVAYVNLPKLFVAGEVVDATEDTCIEDALVTVRHQVSGAVYEGYSGTFGDFHIDVDQPGFYTATFKAEGFKRKTITDIDLRASRSIDLVKLQYLV